MAGWPALHYDEVPARRESLKLADRVRAAFLGTGHREDLISDLHGHCRQGRLRARHARLSPDKGGAQALLIPLSGDRFDVPIDPTPVSGWGQLPAELREELRRHRSRFLLAHELGHSFFFRRGINVPQRDLAHSREEEDFCDEFARWLLIPREVAQRQPLEAEAVFQLHRRYDVSVQLAARAMAEASDGARWALLFRRARADGDCWQLQWASSGSPKWTRGLMGHPAVSQALGDSNPPSKLGYPPLDAAFSPSRGQLVLVGAVEKRN